MPNRDDLATAAIFGDLDKVEKLIAAGAKMPDDILQQVVFSGWAQQEDVRILQRLIDAGADPNSTAGENGTPLFQAALVAPFPTRSSATTKLLLENGADPNLVVEWMSPLHQAVETIADETVALLLKGGADVNAISQGKTPVATCVGHYHDFIYHDGELIEDEIDNAIGYILAPLSHLVKAGADLSIKDQDGKTPLGSVILLDAYPAQIIEALVDAGLPDDHSVRIQDKEIDLGAAAVVAKFPTEVIIKMMRGGADVTKAHEDLGGTFALGMAILRPALAVAMFKADETLIQLRTPKTGRTMLHLAMQNTESELVDFLLAHGVDKDALDDDGDTALQFAQKHELPGAVFLQ